MYNVFTLWKNHDIGYGNQHNIIKTIVGYYATEAMAEEEKKLKKEPGCWFTVGRVTVLEEDD